jgi:hypothetical protein
MPIWLLKILLSFAISLLTKKLGSLAAYTHIQTVLSAAIIKHAPLEPDANPPFYQENNPNIKNHFGGL